MLMRRTSRRGLGLDAPATSFFGKVLGTGNDCSQYATWLLNAGCWKLSPTEWATQMAYGNILPVLAQGGGTSQVDYGNSVSNLATGCQDDPDGCVSGAVTDQTIANQAANLLAMQAAPNASTCSQSFFNGVCDWIVYVGAAAALAGVFLIGRRR